MPDRQAPLARPRDLRDACVQAARELIAERGIENLSLREVARRLGVSHQAPYKHYPSRDHLLCEVMRRCFRHFAEHLHQRPRFDDVEQDLESLGKQYLAYAREHALEYRLMFGSPWPHSADEAGLLQEARQALDVLRDVLRRKHGHSAAARQRVELDALYIWSTMHGLAGVMGGQVVSRLGHSPKLLDQAVAHAMQRMGQGLADAA